MVQNSSQQRCVVVTHKAGFFPGATFIKVNKIIFLKSTKVNPFNLGPNVLNKHPFSPTKTAGVFWV